MVAPSQAQVYSVSCSGGNGIDIQLTQGESTGWARSKYGDPHVCPWVGGQTLPNRSGDRCGQWKSRESATIACRFSMDTSAGHLEERAPLRQFLLQNPETYDGSRHPSDARGNNYSDQVYIINGTVDLACGNFIFDFQVHEVADEKICFGGYPDAPMDIRAIKKSQCMTVFNLQTKEEMALQQRTHEQEQQLCRENELNYLQFPIADDSPEDMADKLFQACLILNDIINNKGHKVYVHCLTGVTRSPTLILLFLCLYTFQNTPKSQIPSLQHLKNLSSSLFDPRWNMAQGSRPFGAHLAATPTAQPLPNLQAILHALHKEKPFYLNSQRQLHEQHLHRRRQDDEDRLASAQRQKQDEEDRQRRERERREQEEQL